MITYILKTFSGEYYCGKTINLDKRIEQHHKEKYPHWFSTNNRRIFILIWSTVGNYEKKIKKFGIKNFIECLNPR